MQFYYISSVGPSECGQILYFSTSFYQLTIPNTSPAGHLTPNSNQGSQCHTGITGCKPFFTMLNKWTAMFYYLQKSPSMLPNTQSPASPHLQQDNLHPSIQLHYSDIHPSFLLWSEGIPIRHALSDWGGIQKLIISTMGRAQGVCSTYSPSGRERSALGQTGTLHAFNLWRGTWDKVRESKTSFTKVNLYHLKA